MVERFEHLIRVLASSVTVHYNIVFFLEVDPKVVLELELLIAVLLGTLKRSKVELKDIIRGLYLHGI